MDFRKTLCDMSTVRTLSKRPLGHNTDLTMSWRNNPETLKHYWNIPQSRLCWSNYGCIEKTRTSTSSLKRTLYHRDDNILAMKYGGWKCCDLVLLFHQLLASLETLKGRWIPRDRWQWEIRLRREYHVMPSGVLLKTSLKDAWICVPQRPRTEPWLSLLEKYSQWFVPKWLISNRSRAIVITQFFKSLCRPFCLFLGI